MIKLSLWPTWARRQQRGSQQNPVIHHRTQSLQEDPVQETQSLCRQVLVPAGVSASRCDQLSALIRLNFTHKFLLPSLMLRSGSLGKVGCSAASPSHCYPNTHKSCHHTAASDFDATHWKLNWNRCDRNDKKPWRLKTLDFDSKTRTTNPVCFECESEKNQINSNMPTWYLNIHDSNITQQTQLWKTPPTAVGLDFIEAKTKAAFFSCHYCLFFGKIFSLCWYINEGVWFRPSESNPCSLSSVIHVSVSLKFTNWPEQM